MKKFFLTFSAALLLLCTVQGGAYADDVLSPVVPPEEPPATPPVTRATPATPAIPNGPGTPATPAVPATPASPAAAVAHRVVSDQANREGTKEAFDELRDAMEATKPVVPKLNRQQGNSYTIVLNPTFGQVVFVEAPSAAVSGWEFSVLQGSRRIESADFPGSENDIFILIVGTQQFEVKGSETYQFTPPVSKFVVKRKTNSAEKLLIGLHYTGTGRTKLGMKPVN